ASKISRPQGLPSPQNVAFLLDVQIDQTRANGQVTAFDPTISGVATCSKAVPDAEFGCICILPSMLPRKISADRFGHPAHCAQEPFIDAVLTGVATRNQQRAGSAANLPERTLPCCGVLQGSNAFFQFPARLSRRRADNVRSVHLWLHPNGGEVFAAATADLAGFRSFLPPGGRARCAQRTRQICRKQSDLRTE
ncbi:MAG: hypothetical protein BJ554DRAFT_3331, partial [Olpidium bornovanus]